MSDMTVNPGTSTGTSQSTASSVNGALDKDSFLKLLIAQLTNQDPTSPMDSAQFVSQMATFTTLEQTQNMSNAIDQLVASQSNQSLSEQSSMIGKQIRWSESNVDDEGNSVSQSLNGVVQAVSLKDGSVTYRTDNGYEVDPKSISEISNSEEAGQSD